MLGTLGLPELLVILALVLIVFGAGKLPDVMSSMGQGVREFRKASEGDFEDDDAPGDDKAPKAKPAASAKAEGKTAKAEPAKAEPAATESAAASEAKAK